MGVHSVLVQLFSGLVELSAEMDVVPDVAQSWEVLEGGRKYIFYLRDDALWSDGTPVTAGDFEYAWKRVLDPTTEAPYAELHEVTLVVELEEPTGYFLYLLANSVCFPVPRRVVEMHGEAWTAMENIITTGFWLRPVIRRGEAVVFPL